MDKIELKTERRGVIDDSHLEPYIPDPVIRQILARRGIKTEIGRAHV